MSAWLAKPLKWQRPIIWTLLIALLLHLLLLLIAAAPKEESIQQRFSQATEVLLYDLEVPVVEAPVSPEAASIEADTEPQADTESTKTESTETESTETESTETKTESEPEAAAPEESFLEESLSTEPQAIAEEQAAIKPRFSKSLITRSLEIARLEAELAAMQNHSAQRPRVRRISSGARMSSEEALYLRQWEEKVERVGNLNYPEAARKQNLGGRLRLLVVIAADGHILEAQLLTGSGHLLLDDAAIRILNLAAPFAPLPDSIKAQADVLEIIRTWQFGDGWYAN